ncbi:MAG: endonuclease/exonuclease/phosphatase family protein [Nocardioides sp.]|uniref:hypothetical protein n=1 Tax=Nocardioides sp. TaxID=35761 RepID=UPI0039E66976
MTTRVLTANVQSSLPAPSAEACLSAILETVPDVIGLQEWTVLRARLLATTGRVRLAGVPRLTVGSGPFTWIASLPGDCLVGLRTDRYAPFRTRIVRLAEVGRSDPGTRPLSLLPPRWATVVEAYDREAARTVGVASFHLVPGSQARGAYRADRPRVSARHHSEHERLQAVVDDLLKRCPAVWVMGDSNFHGLELGGVHSAWPSYGGSEGTLGSHRRIDDVFSTERTSRVGLLTSDSDHKFVCADYEL